MGSIFYNPKSIFYKHLFVSKYVQLLWFRGCKSISIHLTLKCIFAVAFLYIFDQSCNMRTNGIWITSFKRSHFYVLYLKKKLHCYWSELNQHWTDTSWRTTLLSLVDLFSIALNLFKKINQLYTVTVHTLALNACFFLLQYQWTF